MAGNNRQLRQPLLLRNTLGSGGIIKPFNLGSLHCYNYMHHMQTVQENSTSIVYKNSCEADTTDAAAAVTLAIEGEGHVADEASEAN